MLRSRMVSPHVQACSEVPLHATVVAIHGSDVWLFPNAELFRLVLCIVLPSIPPTASVDGVHEVYQTSLAIDTTSMAAMKAVKKNARWR
jgi:hypothetical protein